MARLARIALAGQLYLIVQGVREGRLMFADDDDRHRYRAALLESSRECGVALHAYALMDDEVLLLATPDTPDSLGRFMQAIGRRYVRAFNRRHALAGALWSGRYRATVVDPTSHLLTCMRLIEQAPLRRGLATITSDWPWSSAMHHAGRRVDPVVTEHPAYWHMGNTPFEREARHGRESSNLLSNAEVHALLAAAHQGWPMGAERFLRALAAMTERPVRPRARGRPRRDLATIQAMK